MAPSNPPALAANPISVKATTKFIPAVLIGIVVIAVLFLMVRRASSYSGLPEFDKAAYMENPENLLGNRYLLEGEIDAPLHYREGTGRLVAIRGLEGGPRMPVYISGNLNENVHVGQRYRMKIFVREKGLLYVESMDKY